LLLKEKRYPLTLKYAGKELSRICVIVVRITEKGLEWLRYGFIIFILNNIILFLKKVISDNLI
jgi:hypothetical protein